MGLLSAERKSAVLMCAISLSMCALVDGQTRPTAMPNIITVPPNNGGAPYTFTREQMVHYKLGMPQPFSSEQTNSETWRLVRQLPASSSGWHPTNDNLAGTASYGSVDRTNSAWSVPFNARRPAHSSEGLYAQPNEVFVSTVDFSQWVYFDRSRLSMNDGTYEMVKSSYADANPHYLEFYTRPSYSGDPLIVSTHPRNYDQHTLYHENGQFWPPQSRGSLVFVRLKPGPCALNTERISGTSTCQCNAGFSGAPDACTACPAGSFKAIPGGNACDICAGGRTSPVGAQAASECECNAGFEASAGSQCAACASGKYTMGAGVMCANPPANAFTPNTISFLCNDGFEASAGSQCTACASGKYSMSESCEACPAGTSSYAEAKAVTECGYDICASPDTTTEGTRNFARACGAGGAVGNCGTAMRNPRFSYWNNPGVAVDGSTSAFFMTDDWNPSWWRVDFRESRFITSVTIHSRAKQQHFNSLDNARVRIGNIIHIHNNPQCAQLAASQTTTAQTVSCGRSGRYLYVVANQGIALSEVSTFGQCACPVGQFGPPTGIGPCTQCPTGLTSRLGSTGSGSCMVPCTSNAQNTADGTACVCSVGFEGVDAGEGGNCASCASGKYTMTAGVACAEAPANGFAPDTVSFLCNAGFGATASSECEACTSGKYRAVPGLACTDQPANGFAPDTISFVCNAGFEVSAVTQCAACASGKYRADVGLLCDLVPSNAFSLNKQSWLCNAGYSEPVVANACSACAAGTYKEASGNAIEDCLECKDFSESVAGTISATGCLCARGYAADGSALDTCVECAKGKYKAASANAACDTCPVGSTTLADKAYDLSLCVAAAGFHKDGGAFEACAVGSFKSQEGDVACSPCPTHTTTLEEGAEASSQCLCIAPKYQAFGSACGCAPGFYYVSASQTCEACPAGSFCLGTQSGGALATTTATTCPENTDSDAGAVSQAACACKPGFYGLNTACALCLAGSFKTATGPGPCDPCQSNATSGAGSTLANQCLCNAGFTETNAQCVQCAPNTFKDTLGGALCQNCTAFSASPAGSVSAAACVCDLGYSLTSGACAPCAAGSFGGTAMDAVLARNVPFITSLATDWNAVTQKFDSKCAGQTCVGKTGAWESGTVTTGTLDGHGAGGSVAFVGGTTATKMQWGAGSIPTTFTVCSVTRYSGSNRQRILSAMGNLAGNLNWLNGHWQSTSGNIAHAGSAYYDQNGAARTGNLEYSISPVTNWVVVCGRNRASAAVDGVLVNHVRSAQANGGTGNGALGINQQVGESSDWQFSKLYIWNYHLSDSDFTGASLALNNELTATVSPVMGCATCPPNTISPPASPSVEFCVCVAGMYRSGAGMCQSCPANSFSPVASPNSSMCECNAGFSGANGDTCTACAAGTFKLTLGSALCQVPHCPTDQFFAQQASNVARMCGPGRDAACPAVALSLGTGAVTHGTSTSSSSALSSANAASTGNDGLLTTLMHTAVTNPAGRVTFMIDLQETRVLQYIRFFNRIDSLQSRITGAVIRVGSSAAWADNTICATLSVADVQTHDCNLIGRYVFIVADSAEAMNFRELQAFSGCTACPPGATAPAGSTAAAACACRAGGFRETVVLNPPYALRRYSTIHGGVMRQSLLDELSAAGMAWSAQISDANQWMEIDAGQPMQIVGIITQGRGCDNAQQFVKQFSVHYRIGDTLATVAGTNIAMLGTFSMTDGLKKEHIFTTPVNARYIHIVVIDWNEHISMRAALIVRQCSSCPATTLSIEGSTSAQACQCAAGSSLSLSAASQRAIALVPGRAQLSTLANREGRTHASTAVYSSTAGFAAGTGAVTFDRAFNQYLDGGAHTFDINNNGGFTAVAVVKMTGSPGSHERIFEFGNGQGQNTLMIWRSAQTTTMMAQIRDDGAAWCQLTIMNGVIQNNWQTMTLTWNASALVLTFAIDQITPVSVSCTRRADRILQSTMIGKSLHPNDPFSNFNLAGLYAVDALLSAAEIAAIAGRMQRGEDALQACEACPVNTYGLGAAAALALNQSGAACQSCPANSLSPAASPNSSMCGCNASFSGPNGGTCTPCAPGLIKPTIGPAPCLPDFNRINAERQQAVALASQARAQLEISKANCTDSTKMMLCPTSSAVPAAMRAACVGAMTECFVVDGVFDSTALGAYKTEKQDACPNEGDKYCDQEGICIGAGASCAPATKCLQEQSFRCPNWACAADAAGCDMSGLPPACPVGEQRCPDALCYPGTGGMQECTKAGVNWKGCPPGFQECTNGKDVTCGTDAADCEAKVGCPANLVFVWDSARRNGQSDHRPRHEQAVCELRRGGRLPGRPRPPPRRHQRPAGPQRGGQHCSRVGGRPACHGAANGSWGLHGERRIAGRHILCGCCARLALAARSLRVALRIWRAGCLAHSDPALCRGGDCGRHDPRHPHPRRAGESRSRVMRLDPRQHADVGHL